MSKNLDDEAFELLRAVVTAAKSRFDYSEDMLKLRALLPKAPGVRAACDAWFKRVAAESAVKKST